MNSPTNDPFALPEPQRVTGTEPRRNGIMAGVALIAIGLLLLAGQFIRWVDFGGIFLLLCAAVFAVWGAVSRKEGLFIPAGLLGGLGAGVVSTNLLSGLLDRGGLMMVCFAAGWLSISALVLLFRGKVWLWPAIPAAFFGLIGAADLFNFSFRSLMSLAQWWPVLLVAAGVWVIVSAAARK